MTDHKSLPYHYQSAYFDSYAPLTDKMESTHPSTSIADDSQAPAIFSKAANTFSTATTISAHPAYFNGATGTAEGTYGTQAPNRPFIQPQVSSSANSFRVYASHFLMVLMTCRVRVIFLAVFRHLYLHLHEHTPSNSPPLRRRRPSPLSTATMASHLRLFLRLPYSPVLLEGKK